MAVPYAQVIGDPIAQSKSPLIHKFWLEKLGIDGDYRRQHVAPADLPIFFDKQRRDPDWRGCNVTIPHKQAVIPRLDRIDPLAEKIGAVNTVVREGDGLIGHNSDAPGFLEPLKPLAGRASSAADRAHHRHRRRGARDRACFVGRGLHPDLPRARSRQGRDARQRIRSQPCLCRADRRAGGSHRFRLGRYRWPARSGRQRDVARHDRPAALADRLQQRTARRDRL
jgi:hypothetical protein